MTLPPVIQTNSLVNYDIEEIRITRDGIVINNCPMTYHIMFKIILLFLEGAIKSAITISRLPLRMLSLP